MANFKAIVIGKADKTQSVGLKDFSESDLMEGDVTVAVRWSTLNYKDGLAITGRAPVVRRFPMIPGIDFAGEVESSSHPDWKPGDKVILNGWGVGESHLGAYAQKARVRGDWLVRLPGSMSAREAMAIGTAGYTAMLAVMALEHHGVAPDRGPVLVTGAAGGVGSVGSTTLANLLSMTKYGGAVAACGLAGGMDLPSSVAPFILRGVSLLGIDSVQCSPSRRVEAWRRLESDLDRGKLEAMTAEIGLAEVIETAGSILEGKVRGRIVVKIP